MGRLWKGVRLASSLCLTIWIDKVGGFTWFGSWDHLFPLPEASVCPCLSCSSLLTKAEWTGVLDSFGLQLVDSEWIILSSLYTGDFRFFSFKNLFQLHSRIYVCAHAHMCAYHDVCWGQKTIFRSQFPFFHHVGSRDQTQVFKLGDKDLWLNSSLALLGALIFSVSNSVHYGEISVPKARNWLPLRLSHRTCVWQNPLPAWLPCLINVYSLVLIDIVLSIGKGVW